METLNNKKCELSDSTIDYCEGILDADKAESIKAHIAECAQCAELYREHKEFCEALSACNAEVPENLHEDIMRAVRRESLKVRFARAMKRYAAPVAAALVLAIAVPAIIRNGANNGAVDSPLYYSLTEDGGIEPAFVGDAKGRVGEPTDGVNAEEDHEIAPADTYADIAEAPAAEDAKGDNKSYYQYVVENGEVVTCYNCPIVEVDKDTFKELSGEYVELIVESDKGGALFETDKAFLKALKKAGCDASEAKRADFIRVNVK